VITVIVIAVIAYAGFTWARATRITGTARPAG